MLFTPLPHVTNFSDLLPPFERDVLSRRHLTCPKWVLILYASIIMSYITKSHSHKLSSKELISFLFLAT